MSTKNMSKMASVRNRFKAISQSRRTLAILTFAPLIIFYLFIWVAPITYNLVMSFFERSIYETTAEMTWVGLGNYVDLLTDPAFWDAFIKGSTYTVVTTVLSLVLGLVFALAINERFFGQGLARTLMILPYLIPTLVVAFIWEWMLNPSGILTYYLAQINLAPPSTDYFSSTTYAMPALIVASTWKYTAFAFFTILARLQAIPDSYYERVKMEGGTKIDAFRDITLPNLRGVIFLVLLVRGIFLFNKFDIIWITTQGGPVGATTTLPIMIYNITFSNLALGKATALAGILFGILAVAATVYFVTLNPEEEVTG